MNKETSIQNQCFLLVGCRPDVLTWRQQVGKYRHLHQPDKIVSIGTPGMSDSMMVVAVTIDESMVGKTVGVAVAPEFKTSSGRQSAAQQNWQRAFEARGGVYRLVRSPEEMEKLVEDVKHGKCW